MVTISNYLSGYRILLALSFWLSCCCCVSSVSATADVALSPVVTTAASADNPLTTESALEETLNGLIKDEVAASKVVMERLNNYPLDKRTIGLALQLCMEQDVNLFCAWFTQSKPQQQASTDSVSPVVGDVTSLIDVGVHRIHGLTCFSELRRACNRVSTNNRGRQTQCRPACPPCRQVGCPSRGGCENNCYCTCSYIAGKNWTFDANAAYYPCTQLCSGDAKCPNEADENSATCDDYPASAPNFLFYVVVLGCIGGVAALCSLPFVLPKVRKYCCRGPTEATATATATAADARRGGPAMGNRKNVATRGGATTATTAGAASTAPESDDALAACLPKA